MMNYRKKKKSVSARLRDPLYSRRGSFHWLKAWGAAVIGGELQDLKCRVGCLKDWVDRQAKQGQVIFTSPARRPLVSFGWVVGGILNRSWLHVFRVGGLCIYRSLWSRISKYPQAIFIDPKR
jgi:hypothetical protein